MNALIVALMTLVGWGFFGWFAVDLIFRRIDKKHRKGATLSYKPGAGWTARIYVGRRETSRFYPDSYGTERVLAEVQAEIQDLRSAS